MCVTVRSFDWAQCPNGAIRDMWLLRWMPRASVDQQQERVRRGERMRAMLRSAYSRARRCEIFKHALCGLSNIASRVRRVLFPVNSHHQARSVSAGSVITINHTLLNENTLVEVTMQGTSVRIFAQDIRARVRRLRTRGVFRLLRLKNHGQIDYGTRQNYTETVDADLFTA